MEGLIKVNEIKRKGRSDRMKVVHIDCGLGNQMLSYCKYLALRHAQPEEACYIETLTFDIPECETVYSQWNGYELDRVFGIKAPNIKEFFTDKRWNNILTEIKNSQFWVKHWNWQVYFCEAFRAEGLDLNNIRGDFEKKKHLLFGVLSCLENFVKLVYMIMQKGFTSNREIRTGSLKAKRICFSTRELKTQ